MLQVINRPHFFVEFKMNSVTLHYKSVVISPCSSCKDMLSHNLSLKPEIFDETTIFWIETN